MDKDALDISAYRANHHLSILNTIEEWLCGKLQEYPHFWDESRKPVSRRFLGETFFYHQLYDTNKIRKCICRRMWKLLVQQKVIKHWFQRRVCVHTFGGGLFCGSFFMSMKLSQHSQCLLVSNWNKNTCYFLHNMSEPHNGLHKSFVIMISTSSLDSWITTSEFPCTLSYGNLCYGPDEEHSNVWAVHLLILWRRAVGRIVVFDHQKEEKVSMR
jgi:hypothetical protein